MKLRILEWHKDKANEQKILNVLGLFMQSIDYEYLTQSNQNLTKYEKDVKEWYNSITDQSEKIIEKIVKNGKDGVSYDALRFLSADSIDLGIDVLQHNDVPLMILCSSCFGRRAYNNNKPADTLNKIIDSGYKGSVIGIDIRGAERNKAKESLRNKLSCIDSAHYNYQLERAIYAQLKKC